MAEPTRLSATAGIAAVVLHALSTAGLTGIEAAYHPERLERWAYALSAQEPTAIVAAAANLGSMLALLIWGAGLLRLLGPYSWPGGAVLFGAALIGGMGGIIPAVVGHYVPQGEEAIAQALLGIALAFAGVFRLTLGLALILLAIATGRDVRFPMGCFVLGLLAAFTVAPLVSVAWSPVAADFAVLGDMVWLSWVLVMSVYMRRVPADVEAARAEMRSALRTRPTTGR